MNNIYPHNEFIQPSMFIVHLDYFNKKFKTIVYHCQNINKKLVQIIAEKVTNFHAQILNTQPSLLQRMELYTIQEIFVIRMLMSTLVPLKYQSVFACTMKVEMLQIMCIEIKNKHNFRLYGQYFSPLSKYMVPIKTRVHHETDPDDESKAPSGVSSSRSRSQTGSKKRLILLSCFKHTNGAKLSSHLWFFEGFCRFIQPKYCVLLDVGTKPDQNGLFNLIQGFTHKDIGGVTGFMSVDANFKSEEGGAGEQQEQSWIN